VVDPAVSVAMPVCSVSHAPCHWCQRPGPHALRCSKCRRARFCNPVCQRASWPTHREVCVACRRSVSCSKAFAGACSGITRRRSSRRSFGHTSTSPRRLSRPRSRRPSVGPESVTCQSVTRVGRATRSKEPPSDLPRVPSSALRELSVSMREVATCSHNDKSRSLPMSPERSVNKELPAAIATPFRRRSRRISRGSSSGSALQSPEKFATCDVVRRRRVARQTDRLRKSMLKMRAAAVKLRERNMELEVSIRKHRQDAAAPRYDLASADSTDDEDWYFPSQAGSQRPSATMTEIFDLGSDTSWSSESDASADEAPASWTRDKGVRQCGFDFCSLACE